MDHNLDEACIKLLTHLGRIVEAAAIHAKNDDMLEAVKLLSVPATYSVDHIRPMINYLLTGLRRGLTLGVPPTSNPITSKLFARTDRLDHTAMTDKELYEVSPYPSFDPRVLRPSTPSLRCLKQSDVLTVQVSARSPRLSLG